VNLLQTIAAFVVALGVLIVVHEYGHYLVARLCRVKVLRFSVGFGRLVWSRRFGRDQTEWALSAIPLGGSIVVAASDAGNAEGSLAQSITLHGEKLSAAGYLACHLYRVMQNASPAMT